MPAGQYEENVFINCPFDSAYESLLNALVFTVHDCGFVARSALEIDDSSEVRVEKVFRIISESKYGIHDISRTELDDEHKLPRFNMPLELGFFLAAKNYGTGNQKQKRCLILDVEKFRYQKFCSDIAGQDIRAHGGDVRRAMTATRNWLSGYAKERNVRVPSGSIIFQRYQNFLEQLPQWCNALGYDPEELVFNDRTTLVAEWLKVNSWVPPSSAS